MPYWRSGRTLDPLTTFPVPSVGVGPVSGRGGPTARRRVRGPWHRHPRSPRPALRGPHERRASVGSGRRAFTQEETMLNAQRSNNSTPSIALTGPELSRRVPPPRTQRWPGPGRRADGPWSRASSPWAARLPPPDPAEPDARRRRAMKLYPLVGSLSGVLEESWVRGTRARGGRVARPRGFGMR